ncbi:DNA end protector protein [uncultured Caudovirales phage]|uniref:DNA end protector protein n=1 Tax=uncultured Caudovirales phage TaxID=2100421 RepID=A0A6J5T922_9CAUD|nr:DNA end protector protein [uncultured Caudovirales phage]CAB4170394.1 DNA end protector protein [uncultured Caudovirales phage]CAB4176843.1 DNA end protector protein [uncultured Caudovirales phage]CAB4222977.1 DNA end protector protein [uncultured Caudovirales phage]
MAESLLNIFDKNQYDLGSAGTKSTAWFNQQVLLMGRENITPKRLMRAGAANEVQMTTNILPGNMYMFFYDAKHKDTLPYWDRFPLLLPFDKTATGFMGLNLHYLPYMLRVQLLNKLLQFKNNSKMDETTKLRYSWATISGSSKFAAAKPCVKQYLNSHVRSPFRKVNSQDWATAMLLPVEQFVGKNKLTVWADSKRNM